VPVLAVKKKQATRLESLSQAAEFLSEKIRGKVYPANVRKALDEGYPIGGYTLRLDAPAKEPEPKKPHRSRAELNRAKALAELGELGGERKAPPKVLRKRVAGRALLIYPRGEGPLDRSRKVWR
jgi:hypothetical protein